MLEAIKFFLIFVVLQGATSISALAMDQDRVTKYYIDEVEVTADRFNSKLSKMKETGGWYCRETDTGGTTGYNCKDEAGREYKYTCVTESSESYCSLSRITNNTSGTVDQ